MNGRKIASVGAVCLVVAGVVFVAFAQNQETKPQTKAADASTASTEKGRHLVMIGGCNDCHTPGYAASAGKIPESQWLVGDTLGWRGPWGTTYPPNLRLFIPTQNESDWVEYARNVEMLPPMPWYALRTMSDDELRSIYKYIISLGPAGVAAPAYVPPDKEPKQPYVQFPAPPPAK